jgi:hypothetical protein
MEPDALVEISVLIFGRLAAPEASCTFPVPKITASEHCRVCRTRARTMSGRVLYRIVDGIETGPTPRTPVSYLVTE